jgi:hypothetical protein
MRLAAFLFFACALGCGSSVPQPAWTCDYDASVARPLSEADAEADEAGKLPASVCQNTCGTPVTSCTPTTLDGGGPGAVCPVCTF